METIKLNTGISIPVIGSGTNTFGKENYDYMGAINNDLTELEQAIALGYRHFDTAIMYRNEKVVGNAISKSGIDRKEFFITSKIPGEKEFYQSTKHIENGIKSSLEALNTDYIDLYLIHHPWDNKDEIMSMWRVLEKYVEEGFLKAIGVSNFNKEQLKDLVNSAKIKPAVNQIESHPGHWNNETIEASLELSVVPEAWGPLTKISEKSKTVLNEIGKKYGKTWAQIVLRYQLDKGLIVIPKSHQKERQAQNLELFDFTLSITDSKIISKL